jgi:hypothetical protein
MHTPHDCDPNHELQVHALSNTLLLYIIAALPVLLYWSESCTIRARDMNTVGSTSGKDKLHDNI